MIVYFVLIAFLSGITTVLARILNAELGTRIGMMESTFYNFLVGFLGATIIFIINLKNSIVNFEELNKIPIWSYMGGLLGIIIVTLSNYITPKISVLYLTILMFLGQLIVGVFIDSYITHEISKGKYIGGIFVLGGLIYNELFSFKK
jgi:uncharacterized membrane protein YdcZ (DUF606 family)